MQQQTPPQGRLFPDKPQQQTAHRFAGTTAQGYEPQPRMQQTGPVPVYHSARYSTGSLQTLHGSQPVQNMPPIATMPTAQAYQAAQQGNPILVQTVQGTPVIVSEEQLRQALEAFDKQQAAGKKPGKKKSARKTKAEKAGEKEKKPFVLKLSVFWLIFGLIGIATVLVQLARYVVIPLLVKFF